MRLHSQEFKDKIKEFGRQLDSKITYNETVLGNEQLNAVTPVLQSSLLKSVMKELDIDSNVEIPVGTIINYKLGVLLDSGDYEYLDFGNYIVKEIEKQEDNNAYNIVAYDKMLFSMKEYKELRSSSILNKQFPMTIRDYLQCICNDIGLIFVNTKDSFANYDKIIESDLYANLGYTYRDILDELAQVTASNIIINNNDQVEIKYITNTNDTIDEEYLKDINVAFGEKYGPINSIVLSRAGESDNVYLQDKQSVADNGLCEIKISENQIMNFNDRDKYLPDILERLNGIEYYINDFSSTGICYYEVADRYNVKVSENTYSCVMFNDEIDITQGLEETIHTDLPEQAETDYTKADKTDRRLNQTYLIVDKQNQKIEGLITNVNDNTEKITQLEATTDDVKISVEELNNKYEKDMTINKKTTTYPIEIKDAGAYPVNELNLYGNSNQETTKGKNIFDYITNLKTQTYGLESTLNKDGSITTIGTPTKTFVFILPLVDITDKLEDGETYKLSKKTSSTDTKLFLQVVATTTSGGKKYYYTTEEHSTIVVDKKTYPRYEICVQTSNTLDPVNETNYYMLCKGIDTDFEPYTGGKASPNPQFPSEIKNIKPIQTEEKDGYWLKGKITGKNLLNFNYDRYAWSTGQAITEGSTIKFIGTQAINTSHRINTEFKCFIPKNTKIILSSRIIENANSYVSGWMQLLIRFNYKDGTNDLLGMSFNNKNEATQIKQAIKTLDKDVKSIYAVVGSNGIFSSGDTTSSLTIGMQLEIGDTLSDYEPHKENQFLIDMNTYDDEGNIIGYHELVKKDNIKDKLCIKNGQTTIEKKFKKYVLNGSEYVERRDTGSGTYRFSISLNSVIGSTNIIRVEDMNTYSPILADKFIAGTRNMTGGAIESICYGISSLYYFDLIIYCDETKNMTATEFKNWLSQNPVTIYYALETPEQYQLTPTTIELFAGYNRITIEDENQLVEEVEMTYPTDSRLNGQYATKTELKLTSDSITSEVNKKVSADNFNSTVEDISNKMTQTANRTDSTIQEILSVNNEQNVKINSLTQTTDGLNINISEQQKLYDSLNGKLVEIEGTLKNMSFDFSTKGLAIATSTDPNNSLLDNTGIKVYNYTKLTAIFNNKGSGIDKLIVTTTAQIGYLKIVKSTKNGKPVTKIYHLKKLIESLGDLE